MAAREWAGLAAGGMLAAIGLGAWIGSTGSSVAESPPAPVVMETAVTTTTQTGPQISEQLTGLPASVDRVLQVHGRLNVMSTSDLTAALPESVVRVLVSGDAVLDVKESG